MIKKSKAFTKANIPPISAKTRIEEIIGAKNLRKLQKVIEPEKYGGNITDTIDSSTYYSISPKSREVYRFKISTRKGVEDTSTTVLKCAPKEIIVYDAVLLNQPRTFKITWFSLLSDRTFTTEGETGGATVKEIEEYLVNAGWSPIPRLVGGAISSCINGFIREDKAIIKKDIDNEGFYYDPEKDRIIPIKKEVREPSREELLRSIEVLKELGEAYEDNQPLLATVLKWGLMSGFAYAKKQVGKWMPWLYLKGSAGSGKTTLAKIVLYLYETPNDVNNIGGSGFDTQARVGAKISQTCNPIVVNEPAGAFNRYSVVEMIKVCVESTTGRGKMISGSYRQIPAFSPIIFTANQYLPEDDALLRRLYVLSFSYSMRKSETEKQTFERKFHIDYPVISPLKDLKYLVDAVVYEICSNPSVLMDDWKETIDTLLRYINADIDGLIPDWLIDNWEESESLEDFDDNLIEDIRSFFIREINEKRTKKINLRDENGYIQDTSLDIEEASTSEDFEGIVWSILNNMLLDYAITKISRGTRYICFTQGLRKALAKNLETCNDLKSIGELLGWKYQSVRFSDKTKMVLKVKFDDFLNFMYPNIDLEDNPQL